MRSFQWSWGKIYNIKQLSNTWRPLLFSTERRYSKSNILIASPKVHNWEMFWKKKKYLFIRVGCSFQLQWSAHKVFWSVHLYVQSVNQGKLIYVYMNVYSIFLTHLQACLHIFIRRPFCSKEGMKWRLCRFTYEPTHYYMHVYNFVLCVFTHFF